MNERAQMYAFLSRMFSDILDKKLLMQLRDDKNIVELVLQEQTAWFYESSLEELEEALNVDFTSLFLMNSMPIESSVLDDKEEVLVGLQNPVMQFYFDHGYELHLSSSKQHAPDHISLEFAFKGSFNVCLKLFTFPFFSMMLIWNSDFPKEGKSMTVALLICVPSMERTRGKATVRGLP